MFRIGWCDDYSYVCTLRSLQEREAEIRELTGSGIIPFAKDVKDGKATPSEFFPALMGQCAGAINDVKTASEIVNEVMREALATMNRTSALRSNL